MDNKEIDNFWWHVSVYRKFEWQNNYEVPIELDHCSNYLQEYAEKMNYTVKKYGSKYYIYPNWNVIVERR